MSTQIEETKKIMESIRRGDTSFSMLTLQSVAEHVLAMLAQPQEPSGDQMELLARAQELEKMVEVQAKQIAEQEEHIKNLGHGDSGTDGLYSRIESIEKKAAAYRERMQRQYDTLLDERDSLFESNKRLIGRIEELEQTNEHIGDAECNLEVDVVWLQVERDNARREIDRLQGENRKLDEKARMTAVQARDASLQSMEVPQLKARIRILATEISELKCEISDMESIWVELEHEKTIMAKQLVGLSSQHTNRAPDEPLDSILADARTIIVVVDSTVNLSV